MHGECRSVLSLARYDPADADDMPLSSRPIPGEITVMTRAVGIGHQHADILTDGFEFCVAKLPLGSAAEELHDTVTVDDDHRIRNGFQDGAKMTFAGSQGFFDLLLIVDIDHDAAEVAGKSLVVPHHAAACANPMARSRFSRDAVLHIKTAAALDRLSYGLVRALAVLRFQKGQKQVVGEG